MFRGCRKECAHGRSEFTTPQPTPELRCRHLALQVIVGVICNECGEFVEAHDQITGLPLYPKGRCDCP
jgi:hypothetical protein